MISGVIRLSIVASNFVVVAIPCDEIANAVLNGGPWAEADIAHQIADIGEGLRHVSGLHRQHILYRRAAQLLLQKSHHMHELFRVMITDIVDLRRRASVALGKVIDKAQYY